MAYLRKGAAIVAGAAILGMLAGCSGPTSVSIGDANETGYPATINNYRLITESLIAEEQIDCADSTPISNGEFIRMSYANDEAVEFFTSNPGVCTFGSSETTGVIEVVASRIEYSEEVSGSTCTSYDGVMIFCVTQRGSWHVELSSAVEGDVDAQSDLLETVLDEWTKKLIELAQSE